MFKPILNLYNGSKIKPTRGMTNYKETLNLPDTGFPMKASLPNREPSLLKQWSENNLYLKIRQQQAGKDKFLLLDGPPYANGKLHIGHALNKVLKDVVIKSKTLSGFDAPYIPGWDCHGLPIEHQVEKKKGKSGIKTQCQTISRCLQRLCLSSGFRTARGFYPSWCIG